MSSNKKLLSATLAAAAALTFASAPITSALAAGASGDVQCYGVNSCKGQSDCKTASGSCKGKNSCKGQGFKMMSNADCTKAGGKTSQS
ncbi:MAG: hypothetical protein JO131_01720 [Gammaproteobacteria bacterium]|nr:hypothetical protein [Gammaproteobacteria bacterium]